MYLLALPPCCNKSSGSGLHVGHPEGYTATDIMARYKRMKGFNVLHPMGWDAFGLPAEQYAIQTGTHPAVTTAKNVDRFRTQLKSLGFSYDWGREISTAEPSYYKWTQWIFLQMLRMGLAYQAEVPVNWCPALGTVLANEEVIDGKSERGGHPVVRLPMKQWMLKITAYGDRLLNDLENLDWADSIKEMQRNWIGRSEGALVRFAVRPGDGASLKKGSETNIEVYTTRPDTLFGVTYMVLAPEHPLVLSLTTPQYMDQVQAYVDAASHKSDLERTELAKEKTGVFTGSYAVNPASGEAVQVWVADYVLGGYGSGAIMAVPGHDSRDYEFAQMFNLPIRSVVAPMVTENGNAPTVPFVDAGKVINSTGSTASRLVLDGLSSQEAKSKAIEWLETTGHGSSKVNYKLRDWLFARQRYWGEPFPVIFLEGSDEATGIPEDQLPLTLPDTDDFAPSGTHEPPLAKQAAWVNTVDPRTGKAARRETSTMPQWAGSCWYYLRYIDPHNKDSIISKEAEQYWMPVDLYVGGAEHAVLHLLYARFWHKVLYDNGVVSTPEPFQRLVSQGMILGEVEYTVEDESGNSWRVDASQVEPKGGGYVYKDDPSLKVHARAHKMSKSRGNVVNPDDIVGRYGADSLRLYEMFMGPLRETKVWNTKGVEGVHRFLARVYRLVTSASASGSGSDADADADTAVLQAAKLSDAAPTREQLRLLHQTIKKVTEETEEMRFNTAIACMMEFVNGAYKWEERPRSILQQFILLLSPYAPHLAEEMWELLGGVGSLAYEPWPEADESLLIEDSVKLAIQVNGKTRGTVEVSKGCDEPTAVEAAKTLPSVIKQMDGKEVKKVIFVVDKILNIVVK